MQSATPGEINTGVIRIFPSMLNEWANASFSDLRAEGGHTVSAVWKNNRISWFSIVAGKTGMVRIKDNFDGRTPEWNIKNVKKFGDIFYVNMLKGQKLEARF
jgi:alpha-L-fucosidase 2